MEVKLNSNINPVRNGPTVQKRPQRPVPAADSVHLEQGALLAQSWAAVPKVRPEAVELAKKLIVDPDYPPKETLAQVANILAAKLKPARE